MTYSCKIEINVYTGSSDQSSRFVAINALLLLSLVVSLLAALTALLIKQWAEKLEMGISDVGPSRRRARLYYERIDSVSKGKLRRVAAFIPMLLHISLSLFFASLLIWLHKLNKVLLIINAVAIGVYCILYVTLAGASAFYPNSPYQWPATDVFYPLVWTTKKLQEKFRFIRDRSIESPLPTVLPLANQSGTELDDVFVPKYALTPGSLFPFEDVVESQQADNNDLRLLFQVVNEAESLADIEAGLDQLRRTFYDAPVGVVILAQNELELCNKKAALLMSTCHQFRDEMETNVVLRKEMFERALLVVRFLEWVFQTPVEPNVVHPSYTYLHNVLDPLSNWIIQKGYKEEIVACAAVTIRMLHVDENRSRNCKQIHNPGPILDMLILLYPDSTESADLLHYQQMVTAYLLPLTQCVISFHDYTVDVPKNEKIPLLPYQKALIKATEIFRLSNINSNPYCELTAQLREDWRNLPQDHYGAVWVKVLLLMLGWVPRKGRDGRRVSTRSTNQRHRARLIGMIAGSPPRLPDDDENYMIDGP
jgi:hypothetical protein